MDTVYEVCDCTCDEIYHPMGMFKSLDEVKIAIKNADEAGEAMTESGGNDGEYETIKVFERKFGWTAHGRVVLSVDRSWQYIEAEDDNRWLTVESEDA